MLYRGGVGLSPTGGAGVEAGGGSGVDGGGGSVRAVLSAGQHTLAYVMLHVLKCFDSTSLTFRYLYSLIRQGLMRHTLHQP